MKYKEGGEPILKPQLKLLVTNYLGKCCGNAVQSAIEAGYKPTYAKAQSYKLLAREDVQEYIKWIRSRDGTLACNIMELDQIQEFWSDLIRDTTAKDRDRLRASELLAKSKGAFTSEW